MIDTGAVIHPLRNGSAADRATLAALLFASIGLLLALAGSFLPWVVSGQVRRSSYAITGMIDRLGVAGDGVLGRLVSGWPLIGLLCAAPVVAALLRRWVIAGALGVVLGVTMVAASGALLALSGTSAIGVRVDPIGPSVTFAGALLLTVGGAWLAISAWRNRNVTSPPNG